MGPFAFPIAVDEARVSQHHESVAPTFATSQVIDLEGCQVARKEYEQSFQMNWTKKIRQCQEYYKNYQEDTEGEFE